MGGSRLKLTGDLGRAELDLRLTLNPGAAAAAAAAAAAGTGSPPPMAKAAPGTDKSAHVGLLGAAGGLCPRVPGLVHPPSFSLLLSCNSCVSFFPSTAAMADSSGTCWGWQHIPLTQLTSWFQQFIFPFSLSPPHRRPERMKFRHEGCVVFLKTKVPFNIAAAPPEVNELKSKQLLRAIKTNH